MSLVKVNIQYENNLDKALDFIHPNIHFLLYQASLFGRWEV